MEWRASDPCMRGSRFLGESFAGEYSDSAGVSRWSPCSVSIQQFAGFGRRCWHAAGVLPIGRVKGDGCEQLLRRLSPIYLGLRGWYEQPSVRTLRFETYCSLVGWNVYLSRCGWRDQRSADDDPPITSSE